MVMAWGQLGMAMVTASPSRTPMVFRDLAHCCTWVMNCR